MWVGRLAHRFRVLPPSPAWRHLAPPWPKRGASGPWAACGQDGQDLIEFALAAPWVLLALLGLIEFSLALFSFVTISDTAREQARCAIVQSLYNSATGVATPTSTIQSDCDRISPISNATSIFACDGSKSACQAQSSHTVQVTVAYSYTMVTAPMLRAIGGKGIIPMQAIATMQTEQ